MSWEEHTPQSDVPLKFRASGCFCLHGSEALLIQRNSTKPYGLHWAIPTGKIEAGETPRECMVRELKEELNLNISAAKLELVGNSVLELEVLAFQYFTFILYLDERPVLFPSQGEIASIEWKPIYRIQKRKVVPYFYNAVNAVIAWEIDRSHPIATQSEVEATHIDRRLLGIYLNRVNPPNGENIH